MYDWMYNWPWEFYALVIGTVVTVVILLFQWGISNKQQSKRDLQYDVLYNGPLLLLTDTANGRIQILLGNKTLNRASLLIFNITNSGNTAIEVGNYEQPILFSVPEDVEVLHAEIAFSEPKNIKAVIKHTKNQVILLPTLLNTGDSISIKFILSKLTNDIVFDSRIVGVSKPRPKKSTMATYWSLNKSKFFIFFILGQYASTGLLILLFSLNSDSAYIIANASTTFEMLKSIGAFMMLSSLGLNFFILGTYGGYTRVSKNITFTIDKVERGRQKINK